MATRTITLTLDDDTADTIYEALQEALELMEPFHNDSDPEDVESAEIYSGWAVAIADVQGQIADQLKE